MKRLCHVLALFLPLAAHSAAPTTAATAATAATASNAATPATPGAADQQAHAAGTCGKLGPGTGLSDGTKGWVVSMLPGHHEFRVRGGGAAFVTTSRLMAFDFDAGRPYYLVIEGATPKSVLEWKTPGSNWAVIPTTFLYPAAR